MSRNQPREAEEGTYCSNPHHESYRVIRQASRLYESISMNGTTKKTTFTDEEAADVWLRSWSGQDGDDIAHDYRINPGRVSEVLNGKRNVGSRQVALRIKQQRTTG